MVVYKGLPLKTMSDPTTFLRYPGGKRRMLQFLLEHLPDQGAIKGRFLEPFVGGGAVYFAIAPKRAVLADINKELIELYRGITASPDRVWRLYREMPSTKRGYRDIRDMSLEDCTLLQRAARSLFLNRTCFKGMWRHNMAGKFNIGYGGQDRRWSITRRDLFHVAHLLKRATLRCSDFEVIVDSAVRNDFLFLDPPYRPGEREQEHDHYLPRQFAFKDHRRLAKALRRADSRGVAWALTSSAHPDILNLYRSFKRLPIPRGTGRHIGALATRSGEALISNC